MTEQLTETCPACNGCGELATSHKFTCYECNGTGKVTPAMKDEILAREREIQREFDKRLTQSEYRQMGG